MRLKIARRMYYCDECNICDITSTASRLLMTFATETKIIISSILAFDIINVIIAKVYNFEIINQGLNPTIRAISIQ